jgi:two-component system NarL family sensor kinase
MYGVRDDPLELLRAAGARLAAVVEPREVGREIVGTVTGLLRLPWVALELESEAAWTRVAEAGTREDTEPTAVPIHDGGEEVGRLLVVPRRGERTLGERDVRLLGDLAVQAGPAVRAARLVTELTDSRERLVEARESERRRLRRDLHDSLSPALSGIGLSADTARRLLAAQPGQVDALLQRISVEARDSAEVVRRMLADLRPAALEDGGLVAALEDRASQLIRPGEFDVRVRATDALDDLTAAAQLAAYRIAVEAMTNAARHSGGSRCDVVLERSNGQLHLIVSDDGRGIGPDVQHGVGLTSMHERAEEVGGQVRLGGSDVRGLTIVARIPVGGRR